MSNSEVIAAAVCRFNSQTGVPRMYRPPVDVSCSEIEEGQTGLVHYRHSEVGIYISRIDAIEQTSVLCCWSYDFLEDRTHARRRIRMLSVTDEFTDECLAIRVDRRLRAIDVTDVLSDLFILRGVPGGESCSSGNRSLTIRVDRPAHGRAGLAVSVAIVLGPSPPVRAYWYGCDHESLLALIRKGQDMVRNSLDFVDDQRSVVSLVDFPYYIDDKLDDSSSFDRRDFDFGVTRQFRSAEAEATPRSSEGPVVARHKWALARLIEEINTQSGVTIPQSRLSAA